ncbi:hypothetical protein D3C74_317040 [compost metagenome]
MDLAHRVEAVGDVLLGRGVPATLLGDDVHDHGGPVRAGPHERVLERLDVVAVDGADVLDAQVLEHALGCDDVLEALLEPVQPLVREPAGGARARERALAPVEEVLVAARGAQRRQVVRHAADGRRVGAAVVVDDDHQAPVLALGDVVERLPGHAARERAVADDRDDVPVPQAAHDVGLGDPVAPAQRGRRVRVLDDVVRGLGAARVPGHAVALAQRGEVLAAREQLVHVGLVARVEHERVLGRVEDAVHRERQLDHTEVRSEVPARAGHGGDEELADLRGEGLHLLGGQPPEVLR